MPTVVGVQFNPVTKVYHFDSNGHLDLAYQDFVIVNTSKGNEVAQVVQPPHIIDESDVENMGHGIRVRRRVDNNEVVERVQQQPTQSRVQPTNVRCTLRLAELGKFYGLGKTNDTRDIFRTGASARLLSAAAQRRGQFDTASITEQSDSLRAANLVGTETEQVQRVYRGLHFSVGKRLD